MYMQKPTAVGRSAWRPALTVANSRSSPASPSVPGVPPVQPSNGYEQIVALLENGVAVPMSRSRYAQAASLSSQSLATSVSLLSSTTSRSGCSASPRLTVRTKPRFRSLRSNSIIPAPRGRRDTQRCRARGSRRRSRRSTVACAAHGRAGSRGSVGSARPRYTGTMTSIVVFTDYRRRASRRVMPPMPSVRRIAYTRARSALPACGETARRRS